MLDALFHRSRTCLSHQQQDAADDEVQLIGVVAPLTYSGPYACLGLDFHHLNHKKNSGQKGVFGMNRYPRLYVLAKDK